MIRKDNQEKSRFANCGILLTGRKGIPPPQFIAEGRPAAIVPEPMDNIGFGTGENDWLGAEAYVDSLRQTNAHEFSD